MVAAVRPGVGVRAVVRAVHDERVVGDAQLVEQVEQLPDVLVVVDHRVVVRGLPGPGLPEALRLGVRTQVHVGGVHPAEERRAGLVLAADPVLGGGDEVVVAGLHPLLGQRPGVLDPLLADPAPARVLGVVVLLGGPAVQDTARPEPIPEVRELLLVRIVRQLRLLLGVEVVEVAEELVEAVHRREEPVPVAEMVLAELAGRVALVLQQVRDRRVLGLQPERRARHPHLGQAGPVAALSGDERCPPGRTRLLAVRVGEPHALRGDPVDVRRPIAHQPVAVAAEVGDADVVAPDDEDVRPVRHGSSSLRRPILWPGPAARLIRGA